MHLEGWRTELTSPAIKSFMTRQCCGPHSARPASTNLCLHSDSKHTHHYIHHFKPCTKTSFRRHQLQMFIQAGTHIHKHSSQSVLFVSPCSCSIHLYPLLPLVAALIYKICLNLLLTLLVSFSAQRYTHTNDQPCVHIHELCRGFGRTCWIPILAEGIP